jgi:hypothetical protein
MAPIATTRLAAFESRAQLAPHQVLRHVVAGWRYIPIHPFADDHDLLKRLNWPAERCVSVDAYWNCADDVHFLQVEVAGQSIRGPSLYYRWKGSDAYAANFVAVIAQGAVAREAFESVMSRLVPALPALGRAEKLTALLEL